MADIDRDDPHEDRDREITPYGGFLSHGGTPSSHPFIDCIFHEINPWGTSILGNLHMAVGQNPRSPVDMRQPSVQ